MLSSGYLSIDDSRNHSSTDVCPICATNLDAHVHRLGSATIHTGAGGSKHPMHRECFYEAIKSSPKCPVCRIDIPVDAFSRKKMGLGKRLVALSGLFVATASYHFLMSYLTKSPKLAAAIPGLVSTGISLRTLHNEHRDLGLKTSLRRAVTNDLVLGAITTAIPVCAAAIAERATDSPIKNSCLTTAISIATLLTFFKIFATKQR